MILRLKTLITMAGAVALVAFTNSKPAPLFVWNASESAPIGLYRVQPAGMLSVTTLVVAIPPEPLAAFLAQGDYLPRGVPLLKRILALPGQSVCRTELIISVDGIAIGAARERDRRGRTLPVWQGCRVIAQGEVFLMNWDEPASLDGRYFGPIPASAIIGRAEPLWTFPSVGQAVAPQSARTSHVPQTAAPFLPPGQFPVSLCGQQSQSPTRFDCVLRARLRATASTAAFRSTPRTAAQLMLD